MNAALAPQHPQVEVELPAEPNSVRPARDTVTKLAREVGAPADDVRLAVSEAVGNAVSHAFRDRTVGIVRVHAMVRGGRLIVTVSDNGTGMRTNPNSKGLGMGIPLITKLALDARFDSTDAGTTVSMSFPAQATGGSP